MMMRVNEWRPRKVTKRDSEEAIAPVENTSKGIVPSCEGCQKAENTTSLLHCSHYLAVGATLDICDPQKKIVHVKEEE